MTVPGASPPTHIDLEDLGLGEGARLLLTRALGPLRPGDRLAVTGTSPTLALDLGAWCRQSGHGLEVSEGATVVTKGASEDLRWASSERAGSPGSPSPVAPAAWGLAARGALVEGGGPPLDHSDLAERARVWTDLAPSLYAQATANQWDPVTAVDWSDPFDLPDEMEDAVVQVMTYLVENEQAALLVPARFLARVHPHFREVLQALAVQIADEARHVEIFTRRALLRRDRPGLSGASGRSSLQTLLEEPDFSLALFLLSVLGEGTFLQLLAFLQRYAPDPVTARVAQLALGDEARHVSLGMSHLQASVAHDPHLVGRMRGAVERRHRALAGTSGLTDAVTDALVLIAAGSLEPDAVRTGWRAVQALEVDMFEHRQRRLVRLGFPADEAAEVSALHTKNFM
jgi:hypothetical protein